MNWNSRLPFCILLCAFSVWMLTGYVEEYLTERELHKEGVRAQAEIVTTTDLTSNGKKRFVLRYVPRQAAQSAPITFDKYIEPARFHSLVASGHASDVHIDIVYLKSEPKEYRLVDFEPGLSKGAWVAFAIFAFLVLFTGVPLLFVLIELFAPESWKKRSEASESDSLTLVQLDALRTKFSKNKRDTTYEPGRIMPICVGLVTFILICVLLASLGEDKYSNPGLVQRAGQGLYVILLPFGYVLWRMFKR